MQLCSAAHTKSPQNTMMWVLLKRIIHNLLWFAEINVTMVSTLSRFHSGFLQDTLSSTKDTSTHY